MWRVNAALLGFIERRSMNGTRRPTTSATLDMDATRNDRHTRGTVYCYEKFKECQSLNCWWVGA